MHVEQQQGWEAHGEAELVPILTFAAGFRQNIETLNGYILSCELVELGCSDSNQLRRFTYLYNSIVILNLVLLLVGVSGYLYTLKVTVVYIICTNWLSKANWQQQLFQSIEQWDQ